MKPLWQWSLHLPTGGRHTMKNLLFPLLDKLLLRKPSSIKTLLAKLKSRMKLERSRHRSPRNVFIWILSCRVAYSLDQPKVNIGTVVIPNLCSPYPELGLDRGAWWTRMMPMGM